MLKKTILLVSYKLKPLDLEIYERDLELYGENIKVIYVFELNKHKKEFIEALVELKKFYFSLDLGCAIVYPENFHDDVFDLVTQHVLNIDQPAISEESNPKKIKFWDDAIKRDLSG